MSTRARRLLLATTGAVAARVVLRAVTTSRHAPALDRLNFRGRSVSLAGGPALAVAGAASAAAGAGTLPGAAAALTAGLGAGAVGLYDDLVGQRPEQKSAKGFRGHLAALRQGRVSSGVVKIVGVGGAGLAAAALLGAAEPRPRRGGPVARGLHVLLGAGVIAGTANLANLLDLRPGRAAKAALLLGAPLARGTAGGLAAGPLGATAALLPDDLDEKVMLGDCGANALGAQLGLALAARSGPLARAAILAGIAALTAASERVSFTQVIDRTPVLRRLDGWGRQRDPH